MIEFQIHISGHVPNESRLDSSGLLCSSCQEQFSNPWSLVLHVQEVHGMQIFEEGEGPIDDTNLTLTEAFIMEQ